MIKQLNTITCVSTDARVIRAAKEFPEKLFAVHGDKITLRESAVYKSSRLGIDVSCSTCAHEWSPSANNLLKGQGCPECKRLNSIASAGIRRSPKATSEEKQRAVELKATGMTRDAVAQQLFDEGLSPKLRSSYAIGYWTNPVQAEKHRQRNANRLEEPAKREQHNANNRRYASEFAHGRANECAKSANRRLLKQNTPVFVFIDNEWCEVDRRESWSIFGEVLLPSIERKAIQELYLEAQYQTEVTGLEHEVDHIQPLSKGGEHLMFNLQLLPTYENRSKNDTFREEDQVELCMRLFG